MSGPSPGVKAPPAIVRKGRRVGQYPFEAERTTPQLVISPAFVVKGGESLRWHFDDGLAERLRDDRVSKDRAARDPVDACIGEQHRRIDHELFRVVRAITAAHDADDLTSLSVVGRMRC